MDAERRDRFIAYFKGPPFKGDRQKLMQRTEYTKGRVAQFFDPDQPFGEKAAKNLALRLGLREDAFERDMTAGSESDPGVAVKTTPTPWPFSRLTPEEWAQLGAAGLQAVVEDAAVTKARLLLDEIAKTPGQAPSQVSVRKKRA